MSKRSSVKRRLQVEGLECRTLMTAVPATDPELEGLSRVEVGPDKGVDEVAELRALAAGANARAAQGVAPPRAYVDRNGTLVIHGCGGNDTVNLTDKEGGAQVTLYHKVNGRWVAFQQRFNGVKDIVFRAYDGQNTFNNYTLLPSKALGGRGVDTFTGGDKKDVFYGRGGNDVLDGKSGSDRLYGGTGSDRLRAGEAGALEATSINILKGGGGNDSSELMGGVGLNHTAAGLYGGGGLDYMFGNGGNDLLEDIHGNGYLDGGRGNDILGGTDLPNPTGPAKGVLEMHGGPDRDELYARNPIGRYELWSGDDYFNDDIYKPRVRSLAALDAVFADMAR